MNKLIFATSFTIVVFCVLLIGCDSPRQDSSNEENANDDSQRSSIVAKGKSHDSTNQVIYLGKGYGAVCFGMTYDQLIASIGEPERRQGTACEYLSGGFAVLFNRNKKVAAIMCGGFCPGDATFVERFKGVTPEGVRMGSTLENVLQAYGKPTERKSFPKDPGLVVIRYSKTRVEFAFRNEKLIHITMRMLK